MIILGSLLLCAGLWITQTVGAFAFFSDYQSKQLQAESGVSLFLSAGEGILNTSQQGWVVEQNGVGRYKANDTASLVAEVQSGYQFSGWYDGEVLISKNPKMDYIVEGYTQLEARAIPIESPSSYLYALVLDYTADAENPYPMVFVRTSQKIVEGDTFDSATYPPLTVLAAYTDFEHLDIDGVSDTHSVKVGSVPWVDQKLNITSVIVEDEITPISTAFWFYEFQNCRTIDLSKVNTSALMNTCFTFYDAGALTTSFTLTGISGWDVSRVKDMESMFENTGYRAEHMELCDLSQWDVGQVINMGAMFRDSGYKTTVWDVGDLSNWNTSNVEQMEYMFYNTARRAETFDLGNIGNWDVSKVTNMHRMFYNAGSTATSYNIGKLDSWSVGNVTDMEGLFYSSGYASDTWSVGDLSQWDVGNVKSMAMMFNRSGRKEKNWSVGRLDNWDVSKVEKMQNMFDSTGNAATTYTIGDLSSWKTGAVTNMSYMFYNAGKSASWQLDCSGWDVTNVISHTNFNRGVTGKVTEPKWVQ